MYLRYGHNSAQSEQHEKAVQHLDQWLPTALLVFKYLPGQACPRDLVAIGIEFIMRSFVRPELELTSLTDRVSKFPETAKTLHSPMKTLLKL